MNNFYSVCYIGLIFTIIVSCNGVVDISSTTLQVSDGGEVSISLSRYNKSNSEGQAFVQYISINENSNFVINVNDIPSEVSFIIVQVHSYIYSVTISYDENSVARYPAQFINGTNIGLFYETISLDKRTTATYVANENPIKVDSLIAVVAYRKEAPYPGGCNMEFDIKISPFQKLSYDSVAITVDSQPAALPSIGKFQPSCEKYPLKHDAYRMYMPEQDFANETYFSAIASMLTVQDIEINAKFTPASLYGSIMRRIYSAYPGTGSVYAVVVHFADQASAYVPIVTYACDPSSWSTSCTPLTTTLSKILCALAFFLGLFVAMRGQYNFKFSMFLVSMLIGGLCGYTVASFFDNLDVTGITVTGVCTGLLTSIIWLILWSISRSPFPSVIILSTTFGSFTFYIFYFSVPAGIFYLDVTAYYWLLFSTFIIVSLLIFSVIPLTGNILCFTIIGSYTSTLAIDYYIGSNLKYIIINGIRRTTNPDFKMAVIQPPYQSKDILLTAFWVFLIFVGLYKQSAANCDRAPYPRRRSNEETERDPLLKRWKFQNKLRPYRQYITYNNVNL